MAKKTEKENKEPNKNKKKIMSEPIHHDTALAIEIIKTAPKNREFYLVDGRKLKDLRELALSLGDLPDQAFWHHVNDARNDFANWIEEIFEEKNLTARSQSLGISSARYDKVYIGWSEGEIPWDLPAFSLLQYRHCINSRTRGLCSLSLS